jgi:uncharacterized protein (DUF302 family)
MTIGLIVIAAGVVVGLVAAAAIGVAVMRSKMVVAERSAHSFDETCARAEQAVAGAEGWGFPRPAFDMAAKLAEKGALPPNVARIRQYSVCLPPVAQRVLGADPKLSAIMPCTWSVYELTDGSVWISRMNIALMSKVMGGTVGAAMDIVARADAAFMAEVLT